MIAGVAASVVSGITEPMEFSFMFVAPALFVFHAIMGGISFMLMAAFKVIVGNTGGGLIDFFIWGVFQPGSHWYWIVIVGPFFLHHLLPGIQDLSDQEESVYRCCR